MPIECAGCDCGPPIGEACPDNCGRFTCAICELSCSSPLLRGFSTSDSLLVCVNCTGECEYCGYIAPTDEGNYVDGEWYCDDCSYYCHEHEVTYLDTCYACDEEDDEYYPQISYESDSAEPIRNYLYKPRPVFLGRSAEGFYMGVEHELEFPSREAKAEGREVVLRYNNTFIAGPPFYLKSDSSIHNGFEMVSHPFTRKWFDEHYPQEMLRELQALGAGPVDTSGMATSGIHIHVSKASFTDYHLYKFLHFHYEFPELIYKVAGRKGSVYASFDKAMGVGGSYKRKANGDIVKDYSAALRDIAKKKKVQPGGRYVAVNMQNEDTAELRYFRSTGKIERLRAYVQFVDAIWHYTKVASVQKKAKTQRMMSEEDFMLWLEEHRQDYPDVALLFDRNEAYRPD